MGQPSEEAVPVANITPFGLRLQPGLKRRVDEAAKANGRSINAEIAARLEASFIEPTSASGLAGRVAVLEQELVTIQAQMRRVENELTAMTKQL